MYVSDEGTLQTTLSKHQTPELEQRTPNNKKKYQFVDRL